MDLAQRPGVIHLEIGQPDFPTPAHIVAAANHAAERGHIGYTANAGLPELCEALAAKLQRENGIRVSSEQIIVTIGAMGALYGSLLSVLEPGDQLLVPDPGYPNYRMTAELCGAESVPYPLPAADGYQPDLDALAAAISPRTKAIVVGSPSNPTGTVIHRDRLQGIVELAERHDLYLVSDECYEKIVFDGTHVSPASLGAAESLLHGRQLLQELRHDRLAGRLRRLPQADRSAVGEAAGGDRVVRARALPARSTGSARRAAGVRRRHGRRLPQAARFGL